MMPNLRRAKSQKNIKGTRIQKNFDKNYGEDNFDAILSFFIFRAFKTEVASNPGATQNSRTSIT
uniref:Uncharacterized protein n=1 Tax=Romanomermis culicivorax TaxID=13658 RepID=A0A915I841_ROMCU